MEIKRNKLTVGEIVAIGNKMSEQDGYIDKKIVKDMAILDFCTDCEVKDETTYEEYQSLVDDGIIETLENEIENYSAPNFQCDEVIKDRNSKLIVEIKSNIDSFMNNISNIIDEYSKNAKKEGADLQSLIDKMKEVGK